MKATSMREWRNVFAAVLVATLAWGASAWAEDNTPTVIDGTTSNNAGANYIVGNIGTNNSLVITNAGKLVNCTASIVGNAATASNNWALVTGSGSVWSNTSTFTVGNTGSFNRVTVDNAGKVDNAAGVIGSKAGANANTVTVTGAGSVWNNTTLTIGNVAGATGNVLNVVNSGVVTNSSLTLGGVQGQLNVTNAGTVVSSSIAYIGGLAGSVGNSMTIADSSKVISYQGIIGAVAGANANTVTVTGAGSVWTNTAPSSVTLPLYIGAVAGATGNVLNVANGGIAVNGLWYLNLAGTAGRVNVTNGGKIVCYTYGQIGAANGANNNIVTLDGTGSLWDGASGLIVGSYACTGNVLNVFNGATVTNVATAFVVGNNAGAVNNGVLVSNSLNMASGCGLTIGAGGGKSNWVSLVNNSAWDLKNWGLTLGSIGAVGNTLAIDSSSYMTNVNAFFPCEPGRTFNLVSNRVDGVGGPIQFSGGFLGVGYVACTGTTLNVSYSTINPGGGLLNAAYSYVDLGHVAGANNNTLNILTGTVWNVGSYVYIGLYTTTTGNVLNVDGAGAVVTNCNGGTITLALGGYGGAMNVTNGGKVYLGAPGLYVGSASGANNNTLNIGGLGSEVNSLGAVAISTASSTNNVLNIRSGGKLTAAGASYVGYAGQGSATVSDPNSVWGMGGQNLTVANAALTGCVLNVANSGAVTNIGTLTVGAVASAVNNGVVVTNQGKVYSSGAVSIGAAAGALSNSVTLTDAGSLWNLGGSTLTIGAAGATGNVVRALSGALTNMGWITLSGGTNNQLIVSNATVTATGLTNLVPGNAVLFFSGTMNLGAAVVSNGAVFTVGDGVGAATLNATNASGTLAFSNGLFVASNSAFVGVGTVRTPVSGGVTLTNGATLMAGLATNSPGALTVSGNLNWTAGAILNVPIVSLIGRDSLAGVNWSLVTVSGALTNSTDGTRKNVIRLFGSATDPYQVDLKIMSYGANSLVDTNMIVLDTNQYTGGGTWSLYTNNSALYLRKDGIERTDYTWTNTLGGVWSGDGNWQGLTAPLQGGNTNYTLTFTNSGSSAYTATNNLGNPAFLLNTLTFRSSSIGLGVLAGSNLVMAANGSINPAIVQAGSGAFTISNLVALTNGALLQFTGGGAGTVTLATNISGAGGLVFSNTWNNTVLAASNTFTGAVTVDTTNGGFVTLGNAWALGTNNLTVNNGMVTNGSGGAWTVGTNANNVTYLLSGTNAAWRNGGQALTIGGGAVTGSVLNVNGGLVRNVAALTVGASAGSISNSMTIANTGTVFNAAGSIGSVAGANRNTVTVTGDGSIWTNTTLAIGGAVGATGNVLNAVNGGVVSNSTLTMTGWQGQLNVTNAGKVFGSGAASIGSAGGANSNTVTITDGNSLWNLGAQTLTIGAAGATGNVVNVFNSGVVTNAAALNLSGVQGQLSLTNIGRLYSAGVASIGSAAGANSNTVTITDGNSLWNLGGSNLTIGAAGATGNVVRALNGAALTNAGVITLGGGAAATNNQLIVSNATVTAAALTNLVPGNAVSFFSGTMNLGAAAVSNGAVFTVGDGVNAATLNATNASGTLGFSNGVFVASNSVLAGVGTVRTPVSGGVTLTNGAALMAGLATSSPGALTVSGNLNWLGGAILTVPVTNLTGTAGSGWSLVTVSGAVTNSTDTTRTNVIRLVGSPALDPNMPYELKVMGYGANASLNLGLIVLDTSQFTGGGTWSLRSYNSALYVVQSGSPDYTWTNTASGFWSTNGNWQGGFAPLTGGATNYTLTFTNSGSSAYTATNNLGNPAFLLNTLTFRSSSIGLGVLAGSNLVMAANGSTNPAIVQAGSGAFTISNLVALTNGALLQFTGGGAGAVTLAANISGTGGLVFSNTANNTALSASNTFTGAVTVDTVNGGFVTLGNAWALGSNSVTVNNGMVTNGSGAAYTVGNGANYVTYNLRGPNSVWNNGGQNLTVANAAATGSVLNVANSGVVANLGTLTVGAVASAVSNSVVVTNSGLLEINTGITVGNTTANTNTVTVKQGGILQFTTASPAITINAPANSNAVIMDGAILSYRGIQSGTLPNLTNNWGTTGVGSTCKWQNASGYNTYRLNNSYATNSLGRSYVFSASMGATNFGRLELINGNTAIYGSGVTVSNDGSILFAGTTATMSGMFTNNGSMTVTNSTVTFATNVVLGENSALTWSTNAANQFMTVKGSLTLPTNMTLTVPGIPKLTGSTVVTLFSVTNGITGVTTNWSVGPASNRAWKDGNRVVLGSGGISITNGAAPTGDDLGTTQAVVTVAVSDNGGSDATGYLFYGTDNKGQNLTWGYTNPVGLLVPGVTVTNTITGLLPNTTYYFMYYATNTMGDTGWGGDTGVQFKTKTPFGSVYLIK